MSTTILKIDNKEINLNNHFKTLGNNSFDNDCTAQIKIDGYEHLGNVIYSLIGVCQTALHTLKDYDGTEAEKEQIFGSSSFSIIEVLEIAKNILPMSEFELLEKIRKSSKENNNAKS